VKLETRPVKSMLGYNTQMLTSQLKDSILFTFFPSNILNFCRKALGLPAFQYFNRWVRNCRNPRLRSILRWLKVTGINRQQTFSSDLGVMARDKYIDWINFGELEALFLYLSFRLLDVSFVVLSKQIGRFPPRLATYLSLPMAD
jgi:hypothetical protein